jgi:hypothetical protein
MNNTSHGLFIDFKHACSEIVEKSFGKKTIAFLSLSQTLLPSKPFEFKTF